MPKQSAAASTVERIRMSERAYQYLRSMILEEELSPKSIITERGLAETLKISRTPLRAAISRLEGEGLVERLSNGSIIIRSVSIEELLEILLIRHLLEREAAALAIGRLPTSALKGLQEEAKAFASGASSDFEEFWRHDDALHTTIAEASGKPRLASMVADLRRRARMCHLARMPGKFDEQGREHLAILKAISSGSSDKAREAMSKHFAHVQRRLVAWLSKSS